jgi:hypothetical protein
MASRTEILRVISSQPIRRSNEPNASFRRRDPTKWFIRLLIAACVVAGLVALNHYL